MHRRPPMALTNYPRHQPHRRATSAQDSSSSSSASAAARPGDRRSSPIGTGQLTGCCRRVRATCFGGSLSASSRDRHRRSSRASRGVGAVVRLEGRSAALEEAPSRWPRTATTAAISVSTWVGDNASTSRASSASSANGPRGRRSRRRGNAAAPDRQPGLPELPDALPRRALLPRVRLRHGQHAQELPVCGATHAARRPASAPIAATASRPAAHPTRPLQPCPNRPCPIAEAAVRAGDPQGALPHLTAAVRAKPADAKLRVFLAQLLCVLGQWERAHTQLNVVADMDAVDRPDARDRRPRHPLRADARRGLRRQAHARWSSASPTTGSRC